jgi:hypothetical protein
LIAPTKPAIQALAGFLRTESASWRLRRLDYFEPQDFHLATHRISLQGRLGAALIDHFRNRTRSVLPELDEWEIVPGAQLRIILPAILQPKNRFLLQQRFTARTSDGSPLPCLTPMESARLSGLYLFTILNTQVPLSQRAERNEDVGSTVRLLSALAHLNASATRRRIVTWANETDTLYQGAHERFLEQFWRWVSHDASALVEGLGDQLVDELRQVDFPRIGIQLAARPGDLAPYTTVGDLLLASIRDVLLVVLDSTAPFGEMGEPSPRERLLAHPDTIVTEVRKVFASGMRTLARLLLHQPTLDGNRELATHLRSWVAYISMEAELGKTFVMTFEQPLPLSSNDPVKNDFINAVGQTQHDYPLALRDAASIQVEVALNDSSLAIGPRGRWRRQPGLDVSVVHAHTESGLQTHFRPDQFFDQQDRISDHELSLHSTRGVGRASMATLYVPLHLTPLIFLAYLFASIFFILAAGFVAGAWTVAAVEHKPLYTPEAVFTLEVLGVTLITWLTTVQPSRPLVHKKLLLAHGIFFVGMTVLVIAPLFFAFWWVAVKLS